MASNGAASNLDKDFGGPADFQRLKSSPLDGWGMMSPLVGNLNLGGDNSLDGFPGAVSTPSRPNRLNLTLGNYSPYVSPGHPLLAGGGGGGFTPAHNGFGYGGFTPGYSMADWNGVGNEINELQPFPVHGSAMAMQPESLDPVFDPRGPPQVNLEASYEGSVAPDQNQALLGPAAGTSTSGPILAGLGVALPVPGGFPQFAGVPAPSPIPPPGVVMAPAQPQAPAAMQPLPPAPAPVVFNLKTEPETKNGAGLANPGSAASLALAPATPVPAAAAQEVAPVESKRKPGKGGAKKKKVLPLNPVALEAKRQLLELLAEQALLMTDGAPMKKWAGLPQIPLKEEDEGKAPKNPAFPIRYGVEGRKKRLEAFKMKFAHIGPARAPKGPRYASRSRHARNRKRVGGRFVGKGTKREDYDD